MQGCGAQHAAARSSLPPLRCSGLAAHLSHQDVGCTLREPLPHHLESSSPLWPAAQGMAAIAEGLQLNTSLRQLKLGNNAASTIFGFGPAKAIFKDKEARTGLKTTYS